MSTVVVYRADIVAFGIVYIRGGGDLLGGGELSSTGGEDIVVRVDRLSVNGDEVLNFGVKGRGGRVAENALLLLRGEFGEVQKEAVFI